MTTSSPRRGLPSWRFWLIWMFASIAGAAVYVILIPTFFSAVDKVLGGTGRDVAVSTALGTLSALALGAAIGAAQWLVLRGYLPRSSWWVAATMVGFAVPLVFPWLATGLEPPWLNGVSMFFMWGTVLGALQWLVLRGHVTHAGWWIAISVAGWLLAFGLTGLAEISGTYVEPFDLVAAFLVPVAVDGGGMALLLRASAHKNASIDLPS